MRKENSADLLGKLSRKIYEGTFGRFPVLDRFFRYRDPKGYWGKRGGDRYFAEQEAVSGRTRRSEYLARELKKYPYRSLLEIGCGYGKQLKNLYRPEADFAGCDFSRPQLEKAKEHCAGLPVRFIEADAESIPVPDKSFEMVFSSAVILHNEYEKARRILAEMIRISRRYIAHNEDTDITFSRYGYDMKKTYEKLNFRVLQSGAIACAEAPAITQFTVVELPDPSVRILAEDIPLQYHHAPAGCCGS